jgi:hypothetical protein
LSARLSGWLIQGRGACEEVLGSGGFGPFTVFVEADVEARGADDHVGGFEGTAFDGLEAAFEDASDLAFAALEEAGVVSVPIDGDAIGEVVGLGNLLRVASADEIAFDGVAIGMRTDGAAARMAGKIGRSGGVGRSEWRGGSGGRLYGRQRRSGERLIR